MLFGLAALAQGASSGGAGTIVDGVTINWGGTAIGPAPTIVTEPGSVGAVAGKRVTLSVVAEGSVGGSPLTYQWYFGDTALPGAAARKATYTFVMSAARAGVYRVVVKNDSGETPSEAATVSLYTLPKVTVQPRGQTLEDGAALSLTVQAIGTPEPTYQWSLDGVDIPDATGNTFVIDAVDAFDTGAYRVRVTNAGGAVLSKPASIVVRSAPQIAESPEDAEVMIGAKVRLSVLAYGFPARRYQWRLNGEPIRGDAARRSSYIFTATLARAGVYDVVVTNALGSATSEPATVVVNAPPKITVAPVGAKKRVGQSHVLSVTATGFPEPKYEWFKGTTPVERGNGPTLSFNSLTLEQAGIYTVRISNAMGTVTSKPLALDVGLAPYSAVTGAAYHLDGYWSDSDGDSGGVDETYTFVKGGRVRFQDFIEGEVFGMTLNSFKRTSPTTATLATSASISGVTVTVGVKFTFTTPTSGTYTLRGSAPSMGFTANQSGGFTYSEPGL